MRTDYLVLFVLNAAEMILELVASRLMSPYFGNSNFVWTAIIGIILLAASLGNLIGGKLAAHKYPRFWAGIMLLVTSIYIALTPLIDAPILESIKDGEFGTQFSAVLGSIVFFLIPSILMSVITPIIMKERIGDGKDKAKESGRITAIIAIGSLVGTFVGGFWLIPALGTKMIFVTLAIAITLITLCLNPLKNIKNIKLKGAFVALLTMTLIFNIVSVVVVCRNGQSEIVSIDTEYGRIIVEKSKSGKVLYYKQSGAYSSATYLDDRKYELVFDYLKNYDVMFKFRDVKEVAMIGGAAYQYPKYFISHYPDKRMDVVEIDPESTRIAKEYFFLDDLIQEYGEDRLGLYTEDGRVFFSNSDKKYDAVLNDAFSGEVPVGTLATVEAAEIIKNHLHHDGTFISNVLGAIEGTKGRFLRSEVKTLREVFKHVYVVRIHDNASNKKYTNWLVVATDNDKYKPKNTVDLELTDEDIILTDDYNPIDSLISTDYFDQ